MIKKKRRKQKSIVDEFDKISTPKELIWNTNFRYAKAHSFKTKVYPNHHGLMWDGTAPSKHDVGVKLRNF